MKKIEVNFYFILIIFTLCILIINCNPSINDDYNSDDDFFSNSDSILLPRNDTTFSSTCDSIKHNFSSFSSSSLSSIKIDTTFNSF